MTTRRVIGCMTGTSLDGLDLALVEIHGRGEAMHATFIRGTSTPFGDLAPHLRALAEQKPHSAHDIARIARNFSLLHASAAHQLLGSDRCDFICVHGQTVFHAPPLSWQLFQPAPLAHALGVPVCFDLRQADLAKGGQGAPITPIADAILMRGVSGAWAVANLGGFCNITLGTNSQAGSNSSITTANITARDVCSCNQLLDSIARSALNLPFDMDGQAALTGTVRPAALADLESILQSQQAACRSLGTGDELGNWSVRHSHGATGPDLAATACAAIARQIHLATAGCTTLLLAGGGVRNKALFRALASHPTARVATTQEIGVPPEYREAICFAILGALCQDRIPITLPQVTGCTAPAPISGCWTS